MNPNYAGFGRRLGATFIDLIVLFFISIPVLLLSPFLYDLLKGFGIFYDVLIPSIPIIGYVVLYQAYTGQTLGKQITGIKIVTGQGNKPSTWAFFLREIIGKPASLIILLIGYLMVLWDNQKQSLHDKLAGTFVVRVEPAINNTVNSITLKNGSKIDSFSLSAIITGGLMVSFIFIQNLLWQYFYSIGLSDTAPHPDNTGQGAIIYFILLPFFFIFSIFLARKFLKDPRSALKMLIIIAVICTITILGVLFLFLPKPKDLPETLFNRGSWYRLMRDHPDFARKPDVYSVIKSYYMSQDTKKLYGTWIISDLEQLLKVNPEDTEIKDRLALMSKNLGIDYYDNNRLDRAIEYLKIAIQYDPKQPSTYVYLGLTYEKKGESEEAVKQYRTVLQLDPNNQTAKENLRRLQKK